MKIPPIEKDSSDDKDLMPSLVDQWPDDSSSETDQVNNLGGFGRSSNLSIYLGRGRLVSQKNKIMICVWYLSQILGFWRGERSIDSTDAIVGTIGTVPYTQNMNQWRSSFFIGTVPMTIRQEFNHYASCLLLKPPFNLFFRLSISLIAFHFEIPS